MRCRLIIDIKNRKLNKYGKNIRRGSKQFQKNVDQQMIYCMFHIKIIMIKLYLKKIKNNLNPQLTYSYLFSDRKRQFFNQINQSMYYRPRVHVSQFLHSHHINFRQGQKSIRVKQCKFCQKPHYNDLSNLFVLTVDKATGVFHCFRCSAHGSWMDFKKRYLGIDQSNIQSLLSDQFHENSSDNLEASISDVEFVIYQHNLFTKQFQDVREYLKGRGFTQETIKKYKLGAGIANFMNENGQPQNVKVVYFPMYKINRKNTKQSQQYVSVIIGKSKLKGASKETKKYLRQYPSGPGSGFFGLNTIKTTDKTVVITQGQFDAMAVNQQTGYPTISLPLGANSFPDSLLAQLNQFQKIILWMDNDQAGKIGCDKISHKLGIDRTHIVKANDKQLKDANDYLLKKPQIMKQLLETSKSKNDENILTFTDLRDSVKNRIYKYEEFTGVKIDWLPFFNKRVKGVRMQELTVFSGPTGSGKTTFLSQLTLDLCKKGIPILWGSFEIRNQILLTNMIHQFSQINMFKNRDKYDYFADMFQKLPLYYLSFHGSTHHAHVLDILEYAIQKNNISVVVIDTLQFFLSGQAQGTSKFDLQERVLAHLRRIATNYKVHIIVVIHPRKVQQSEDIQLNSIYGSSKATQQADNVWIIQNRQNFRILDIKKNRFDGELGKTAIGFDKSCKRFTQLNKHQLTKLYNKQMTMEDILDQRNKSSQSDDDSYTFTLGQEEEHTNESQMLQKSKYPKKKNPYF